MDKLKVLIVILLCIGAVGLSVALGLFPARTAIAEEAKSSPEELAKEIRALCDEIKLLRLEIRELRGAIGPLAQQAQETQVTRAVGKETVVEQPPRSQVGIEFTKVPPRGAGPGSRGNIAGRVVGVKSPQNYKIVLYALTDRWYVQPLVAAVFTDIKSDGTWSNWTHLGYRYAAAASVRPSFRPQSTVITLPSVSGDVIAEGEVSAR